MEKENLHFRHYCSARHNEKILAARIRHKAEGYAAYFMILERLLESHDHMSTRNYNNIAYDLRMSASVVKSVVEDLGLFTFTDDGTHFFPNTSITRTMKPVKRGRKRDWHVLNQERAAGIEALRKQRKNLVRTPFRYL